MNIQKPLDCHRATRQNMSDVYVHELQWFVRMIDFASTDSKVIEHKLLQFTLMIPRDDLAGLYDMVEICRSEVDKLGISKDDISAEMRHAGAVIFNLIANEVTYIKSQEFEDISHKLAIAGILNQLVDYFMGANVELREVEITTDQLIAAENRMSQANNFFPRSSL